MPQMANGAGSCRERTDTSTTGKLIHCEKLGGTLPVRLRRPEAITTGETVAALKDFLSDPLLGRKSNNLAQN